MLAPPPPVKLLGAWPPLAPLFLRLCNYQGRGYRMTVYVIILILCHASFVIVFLLPPKVKKILSFVFMLIYTYEKKQQLEYISCRLTAIFIYFFDVISVILIQQLVYLPEGHKLYI